MHPDQRAFTPPTRVSEKPRRRELEPAHAELLEDLERQLANFERRRELAVEALTTTQDQIARMKEALPADPASPEARELREQRKTIYCFVGFPGAGKSTQIEAVRDATGAPIFHMGSFAKSTGEMQEAKRKKGELLDGLDEAFLQRVVEAKDSSLILDGFPRSPAQVAKLYDVADQKGWDVRVIHIAFPEGEEIDRSLERQISRAAKEEKEADIPRFVGKIARAIAQDMAAVESIRHIGGHVVDLDGSKPREAITQELREKLSLDFESLEWERDIFEVVEKACKQTGIEAWPGAGLMYRPFFNGKFGPHQLSTDKDVHVGRQEDVEPMLEALQKLRPDVRWSVDDRKWDVEHYYGQEAATLEEAMMTFPLTFREGAARLKNGKIDIVLKKGVEADLRNGIVRLDEELLEKLSPEFRKKVIERAVGRARKIVTEYPGLTLQGLLAEEYAKVYEDYKPRVVESKWEKIEHEVQIREEERGVDPVWRGMTPEERVHAEEVRAFYVKANRKATAPPRPSLGKLPGILEDIRNAKQKSEFGRPLNAKEAELASIEYVDPPEGHPSWLEYSCAELDDSSFHEWLLDQVRSRKPKGGKDAYLRDILSYDPFKAHLEKRGREATQKPTHQGWELKMHLQETMLQLHTDPLTDALEEKGASEEAINKVRMAMRLALLFHDTGKVVSVNAPGAHELIGAKFWRKLKPEWVDEETAKLTEWIIRTHDLFGRLARGITEKQGKKITDEDFDVTAMTTYRGALDPEAVREELRASGLPLPIATAIHKAIWQADVSSVSSLRWILPIADVLEEMILVKQ